MSFIIVESFSFIIVESFRPFNRFSEGFAYTAYHGLVKLYTGLWK